MTNLETYLNARKRSGTETKAGFAGRAGISPEHLSRILSGKAKPSRVLKIVIEQLTGGAVPVSAWAPKAKQ